MILCDKMRGLLYNIVLPFFLLLLTVAHHQLRDVVGELGNLDGLSLEGFEDWLLDFSLDYEDSHPWFFHLVWSHYSVPVESLVLSD